ncbi:MAG TPA: RES family NAD+ phosphorylase [Solirubrobacterales bacterium]|nr:RES family NAD+ phosphorylase [Solirubrobacterales bacterium]
MALDVDRARADGVWYRHLPHRGSVWWRSQPAPDGHWQRGSEVAGFYLADSRETAWAEWYRQIDELALRPADQLPRDLWRFEVGMDEIADLRSEAQLARVGLDIPMPRRHEWPDFQAVGEQLHAGGLKGVLAPSAARSGTGTILCLFRESEKINGVRPLPPPSIQRNPPPR